ncbi:MAG TPA: hypothetical protein VGP33_02300 [Chloroflexota bacterium]|nr:hypothetical protein [Chloroflexota bacterium]
MEAIQTSYEMEAQLTADPTIFRITPAANVPKAIPDNGFGEWDWIVTPLKSGNEQLTLSVLAHIKVPNSPDEIDSIRVKQATIHVQVDRGEVAGTFFHDIGAWIATGIVGSAALAWTIYSTVNKKKLGG